MESTNLRIENWEKDEVEEISYSASLKVPSKERLLRLLPTHLKALFYPWHCYTGILSTIDHSFKLCLYREYSEPKIGLFVSITNGYSVVEVRDIDVTYVLSDELSVEDNMTRKEIAPKGLLEETESLNLSEFWHSTCGWPEKCSKVFIVLHIVKRKPPRIVVDEEDVPKPFVSFNGAVDICPFFLSQHCSDVTIQCGSEKFPAHLLVLTSRSSYFSTMFSTSMKETKERCVKIEDMSPSSVKELLRFIYTGEIESPDAHSRDLFIAADKYGMDDLKRLCECHLVSKLSVDNALQNYDLCQIHGGSESTLGRKAKEIILWNKGKFAPDPETLVQFTTKYPQLVFDLLNFQSS